MTSEIKSDDHGPIDLNLSLHELGHALAEAEEGADFVRIQDCGAHATATGFKVVRTSDFAGPVVMDNTLNTLAAGPAFSVVLDTRFSEIDMDTKLREPLTMLVGYSGFVGATGENSDLGRIARLDPKPSGQELAAALRKWMLIAEWQRDAWLRVGQHVVDKMADGDPAFLIGNNLRSMVTESGILSQMAGIPGIFVTAESRGNILSTVNDMACLGASDTVALLGQNAPLAKVRS